MRWLFAAGLLVLSLGCGGDTTGVIADKDELATYVAENPSPEAAEPGSESADLAE